MFGADPITKEEFYLDFLADGGDITKLPEPFSRTEKFLYALCQNRRFLKLRKGETNLEVSYDNGTTWTALIPIADLQAAPAAAVADSVATDVTGVVADLNELLASLRAANVIAAE